MRGVGRTESSRSSPRAYSSSRSSRASGSTFASNLAGHLSLFAMDAAGGVPEPLLPPQIALQNPELVGGHLFRVLPASGGSRDDRLRRGRELRPEHRPGRRRISRSPSPPATFAGGRAHLDRGRRRGGDRYFAVESRRGVVDRRLFAWSSRAARPRRSGGARTARRPSPGRRTTRGRPHGRLHDR